MQAEKQENKKHPGAASVLLHLLVVLVVGVLFLRDNPLVAGVLYMLSFGQMWLYWLLALALFCALVFPLDLWLQWLLLRQRTLEELLGMKQSCRSAIFMVGLLATIGLPVAILLTRSILVLLWALGLFLGMGAWVSLIPYELAMWRIRRKIEARAPAARVEGKRMIIDKEQSDYKLVLDGRDTGYRRTTTLETPEHLRELLLSRDARVYINQERAYLDLMSPLTPEEFNLHYRQNLSFLDEDSPQGYPNGYVYFAQVYTRLGEPDIAVLFYNH